MMLSVVIRPLTVVNIILASILMIWALRELYLRIVAKKAATFLSEEEFKQGMRKAQIIDVREKEEFRGGHILGARNFPYSMIKTMTNSIRKDQPIYLYDSKKALSIRVASRLKKEGFTNLYILKDGFDGWQGKVKRG